MSDDHGDQRRYEFDYQACCKQARGHRSSCVGTSGVFNNVLEVLYLTEVQFVQFQTQPPSPCFLSMLHFRGLELHRTEYYLHETRDNPALGLRVCLMLYSTRRAAGKFVHLARMRRAISLALKRLWRSTCVSPNRGRFIVNLGDDDQPCRAGPKHGTVLM